MKRVATVRIPMAVLLMWITCSRAFADVGCDSRPGERVFTTKCGSCHSIAADGKHAAGPNLRGVIGRAAGSSAGFGYSPEMKALGISWSPEELDRYLYDPPGRVAGTYMAFTGLKRAADRSAVICFLQSLGP
jgi:cytochrome c